MNTPIVPTLITPHEPGKDLLWCASLDLAWVELRALVGGPVALDVPPDTPAAALARALNGSPVTPGVADPRAYVALAGLHTEAWTRRALAELHARFGESADARLLECPPEPDLFVAYAYLAETLAFPTPLMREHGRLGFRATPVESFGLWDSTATPPELRAARVRGVLVHHHRFLTDEVFAAEHGREPTDDEPAEEFVVELVTKDRADRLIVARCVPGATLAETVSFAMRRLREDVEDDPTAFLGAGERCEIPCIDLDLTRRYGELYGAPVANPGFEGRAFGEVVERVRFHLDEGGASLLSEARLGGLSLPPRSLRCDGPFLVMILRRGAPVPALALWVETTDLLM
jgi:hypothetical protein